VSLDVAVEVAQGLGGEVQSLLPRVDWIFPNELESELLVGHAPGPQAVEQFLSYGLEAVILKRGRAGCVIGTGDALFSVPAFSVEVQDTTGAGDSFAAGFIAGRLSGLSWRSSGVLANALGGLAASVFGAGVSLPGRVEVIEFLEQRAADRAWRDWQDDIQAVLTALGRMAPVERDLVGTSRPEASVVAA
jgi:sugar/nucleoside kinase (ribokinase family)